MCRMMKAIGGLAMGLMLLSACVVASAQEGAITWAEAQEMLRKEDGLSRDPLLAGPVEEPQAYGAEANPTGDPIGGGPGYSRIVTKGDYTVGNAKELLAALEKARDGQTVYVKPDAKIDLSGQAQIRVPDGVTLAGNRGQNNAAGPLLFVREPHERIKYGLIVLGERARFTGLRLVGPDPDYDNYTQAQKDAAYQASARAMRIGEGSEVDNCEIANFYREGVGVKNARAVVRHCYLHDIAAYPVIVSGRPGSEALIEANIIHWGWHATAGTGEVGTGYEARYNIFRPHKIAPPFGTGVSHCLDQHADRGVMRATAQVLVGDWLSWHHNTIYLEEVLEAHEGRAGSSPNNGLGMKIRGNPQTLAKVYRNWFPTSTDVERILGPYGGRGEQAHGNVWVYDNAYGESRRRVAQPVWRTTPQIRFRNPPPPTGEPHKVRGTLALNIEVNTLESLELAGVIVKLDDEVLWLEERAPNPGEVTISVADLGGKRRKLSVSAIDTRGALGTHYVFVQP